MSVAALRRRLAALAEQASALSEQIEEVEEALASIPKPHRPFSFTPAEAAWGLGTIHIRRRPREPLSSDAYWHIYADQIQALFDEEYDQQGWITRIEREDPSLWGLTIDEVGPRIIKSDWVCGRIGSIPGHIFPEQFVFDPECDDTLEEQTFESFFHLAFPEAS